MNPRGDTGPLIRARFSTIAGTTGLVLLGLALSAPLPAQNLDDLLGEIAVPTATEPAPDSAELKAAVLAADERRRIENRIRYLEADSARIRAQLQQDQQRQAADARYRENEKRTRQAQRESGGDGGWIGKALAIGGMAAVVSQAQGISSELAAEFMVQFSAGVISEQNPAALAQSLQQVTHRHLASQQSEINRLRGGLGGSSGGYGSASAKPPRIPSVCSGYTLANYKAGRIVGDPQIDTQCQSVMARYDQYASNVGHPDARPEELEKAYRNHVLAGDILDRYAADTQETGRVSTDPLPARQASAPAPRPQQTPTPPPQPCPHEGGCGSAR